MPGNYPEESIKQIRIYLCYWLLSPSKLMQCDQHFCHYWKPQWNWLLVTASRTFSSCSCVSDMDSPLWVCSKCGLHLAHATLNTHWEATERVMAAKLIRLTQKIKMLLNTVAETTPLALLSPNGKFENFWIHLHTHNRLHQTCKRWTLIHSTSVFYVVVRTWDKRKGRNRG